MRRAPQRAIAPLLSHLALHLGPEAPRKSAISRPENPPTSSTCSTATKSSFSKLLVTSPCAGMLGTVPHHLQPPCCPYRCRNRKPFRAAGRGRPAGASGRRTRWSGPPSPQIEVRTEEPSTLVTTATSAQAQPSTELRGRRGKQQHGVGQHAPGRTATVAPSASPSAPPRPADLGSVACIFGLAKYRISAGPSWRVCAALRRARPRASNQVR